MKKVTYVTKPALPELDEFIPYLEDIWRSKKLTNQGKYHRQLEDEMAKYLGVNNISLFANGTLALLTAIQALEIKGEVITTPFSFVATSHALWWNKLDPVFVDIESRYCNIDPGKIIGSITKNTSAILPVHVYGNPCNVTRIKEIADNYGLKVIYDAAHAFGVKLNKNSILNFGDLSILSFHATKSYTTIEGGAVICHDDETKMKIDYLKNFGFKDETHVIAPGINSKMNEIQAALGLIQLKYHSANIAKRKGIADEYKNLLNNTDGISMLSDYPQLSDYNYSYLPIFIDQLKYGKDRDWLYFHLKKYGIHCRRYFYPLISNFPHYSHIESAKPKNLPVANIVAEKVLCLPIYPDLEMEKVRYIVNIIQMR